MSLWPNVWGLGALLSFTLAMVLVLFAKDAGPLVLGLTVGVGCSALYIIGMLVGRADERRTVRLPGEGEG